MRPRRSIEWIQVRAALKLETSNVSLILLLRIVYGDGIDVDGPNELQFGIFDDKDNNCLTIRHR